MYLDCWYTQDKTFPLYLRLIPKQGWGPSHSKNFRPISVTSCDSVMISKISNCLNRALTSWRGWIHGQLVLCVNNIRRFVDIYVGCSAQHNHRCYLAGCQNGIWQGWVAIICSPPWNVLVYSSHSICASRWHHLFCHLSSGGAPGRGTGSLLLLTVPLHWDSTFLWIHTW